jgi:prepilin-type N-terminal cleavage/methylation domain-containing protein
VLSNKKEGITLIELLVVIVLIGVISLVAVPNVRDFIITRDYKDGINKINTIINTARSDIDSKKIDPISNLPYQAVLVSINQTVNGLEVQINKADSGRVNLYASSICDINLKDNLSYWNILEKYNFAYYITVNSIKTDTVSTSKNEVLKELSKSLGQSWACYTKEISDRFARAWFDQYSGGRLGLCHKARMPVGASNCVPDASLNNPYYGISISKFGVSALWKYDYASSTWKEEQN